MGQPRPLFGLLFQSFLQTQLQQTYRRSIGHICALLTRPVFSSGINSTTGGSPGLVYTIVAWLFASWRSYVPDKLLNIKIAKVAKALEWDRLKQTPTHIRLQKKQLRSLQCFFFLLIVSEFLGASEDEAAAENKFFFVFPRIGTFFSLILYVTPFCSLSLFLCNSLL